LSWFEFVVDTKMSKQLAILIISSVIALVVAYGTEYGFGFKPCILCTYQRIAYFVILVCSIVAAIFNSKKILLLAVLALIAGGGIAFYQVAVEKHFVPAPTICNSGKTKASTVEELRKQIMEDGPISPSCEVTQFEYAGISFAGWNVIFSIAVLWALRRAQKHAR
jgi:disulfide bond formation protein DsbB